MFTIFFSCSLMSQFPFPFPFFSPFRRSWHGKNENLLSKLDERRWDEQIRSTKSYCYYAQSRRNSTSKKSPKVERRVHISRCSFYQKGVGPTLFPMINTEAPGPSPILATCRIVQRGISCSRGKALFPSSFPTHLSNDYKNWICLNGSDSDLSSWTESCRRCSYGPNLISFKWALKR